MTMFVVSKMRFMQISAEKSWINKEWIKHGVNKLLTKLRDTGTVDRAKNAHTTTGSFQSHPHFTKKITSLRMINILNILLTHKYTQQSAYTATRSRIKIGARKMHLICIFFHVC